MDKANAIVKIDTEGLIAKGIEHNLPVETMEKLLAMRQTLKAEAAREAFYIDLAALQSEMPTIEKSKKVLNKDGSVRYAYAPLENIVAQLKGLIDRHGFSYTIKTKQNGALIVTCEVHHTAGHTEATDFTVPIDSDSYMSAPQKVGAANTYAKRYAFCNAFGILTGDEDTDAVETEPEKTKSQLEAAGFRVESVEVAPTPKAEPVVNPAWKEKHDKVLATLTRLTADMDAEGKQIAWNDTFHACFSGVKRVKKLAYFTIDELAKMEAHLGGA